MDNEELYQLLKDRPQPEPTPTPTPVPSPEDDLSDEDLPDDPEADLPPPAPVQAPPPPTQNAKSPDAAPASANTGDDAFYQELLKSKFDPRSDEYKKRIQEESVGKERNLNQARLFGIFGQLQNGPGYDFYGTKIGGGNAGEANLGMAKNLLAQNDDTKGREAENRDLLEYLKERDNDKYRSASLEELRKNNKAKNDLAAAKSKAAGPVLGLEGKSTVTNLSNKNADKLSILNQLKSDMNQFNSNTDEDQKVAYGEQMLKTLNSKEGKDAVGEGEANRLGSFLKFKMFNYKDPGSAFGRDIDKFGKQAEETIAGIAEAIKRNENQIDTVYGKPGRNVIADVPPSGPLKEKNLTAAPGGKKPSYAPGQIVELKDYPGKKFKVEADGDTLTEVVNGI